MYRDEGEDCGVAIAGRVSTRASTGAWLGLDTAALEAGDGPVAVDATRFAGETGNACVPLLLPAIVRVAWAAGGGAGMPFAFLPSALAIFDGACGFFGAMVAGNDGVVAMGGSLRAGNAGGGAGCEFANAGEFVGLGG